MKKTLAMFPGQGSQYIGMGRDLLSEFSYIKSVFEEAEDSIAVNIRKLCFDGPEDELRLTENLQPCILTTSIAIWRVLQQETDFKPQYFAGHSLGEYSALVASNKLAFSQAVSLVKQRGASMQKAVPEGKGAMAAVLNCDGEFLVGLCSKINNDNKDGSVEVVNFNSPQQLIISGSKAHVEEVVKQLEGVDKVRCTILPVSAPFHSKLMNPAKLAMTPALKDATLTNSPEYIIANLTGKLATPYTINLLIEQIDNPVLWTQTIDTAIGLGLEQYVEVGPGRVLFGLARRMLPRETQLLHSDDIKKIIEDLTAK